MTNDFNEYCYLCHHGILGMKWGVRRYQNSDGSLTAAGKKRYSETATRKNAKDEVARSKSSSGTAKPIYKREITDSSKKGPVGKISYRDESGKAVYAHPSSFNKPSKAIYTRSSGRPGIFTEGDHYLIGRVGIKDPKSISLTGAYDDYDPNKEIALRVNSSGQVYLDDAEKEVWERIFESFGVSSKIDSNGFLTDAQKGVLHKVMAMMEATGNSKLSVGSVDGMIAGAPFSIFGQFRTSDAKSIMPALNALNNVNNVTESDRLDPTIGTRKERIAKRRINADEKQLRKLEKERNETVSNANVNSAFDEKLLKTKLSDVDKRITARQEELSKHQKELEAAGKKPRREIDNYLNLLDPNTVNPDWKKKNRR